MTKSEDNSTQQPAKRASAGELISRALRLRCPRCGEGKLFAGYFRMHANCSQCRFRFERDPGYFLGSAYINYGLTALLMTILYVTLAMGYGLENRVLIAPLLAFVVIFPLLFFRYARSLWLAMDCYFDRTGADELHDEEHSPSGRG